MRKELDEATLEILRSGTEEQLRELEMPWPKDEAEMVTMIHAIVEREHNYGTCVYAMSIAGECAFNWAARKLGVTGFQASCADMDIIRRTRMLKGGFAILKYEDLLYPQYREHFDEMGWEELIKNNKDWLRERASELLAERGTVHPNVRSHWERLAAA